MPGWQDSPGSVSDYPDSQRATGTGSPGDSTVRGVPVRHLRATCLGRRGSSARTRVPVATPTARRQQAGHADPRPDSPRPPDELPPGSALPQPRAPKEGSSFHSLANVHAGPPSWSPVLSHPTVDSHGWGESGNERTDLDPSVVLAQGARLAKRYTRFSQARATLPAARSPSVGRQEVVL